MEILSVNAIQKGRPPVRENDHRGVIGEGFRCGLHIIQAVKCYNIHMDSKFFLESWRLANKSSERIRWVLTGAVAVYFLYKDYALTNSWCFWLNMVLTIIGFRFVVALVVLQHEMLELDEKCYEKGANLEQHEKALHRIDQEMSAIAAENGNKLELDEKYYEKGMERKQHDKAWHRIDQKMSDIKEENGNNLEILKKRLFWVYVIAGISVIIPSICIHYSTL